MPYGMLFVIAMVLLLGWLHSSRKEAARQDVDRRIVPAVLDAVFQEVQFAPNGRITCFGEAGLPLPQYDRMTGGEHVRATPLWSMRRPMTRSTPVCGASAGTVHQCR